MNFFGITQFGSQNYFKEILKDGYQEPYSKEEVGPLLKRIEAISTLPKNIERPDVNVSRQIDCYIGRVNGFAYGSALRLIKMKKKGVIKPVGPCDMYRIPPVSSIEYGWWLHDTELLSKDWYVTSPRYPQPSSPNSIILDIVRKNNKYASLF